MRHLALFLMASALPATAAFAQQDPLAPLPKAGDSPTAPAQELTPPQQAGQEVDTVVPVAAPRSIPRDWPGVFAAIRAGDWAGAQAGIAALPDDLIRPFAMAEYYTAKGSPRVDLPQITALLTRAPELPQAPQLQRLAITRGALTPPPILTPRELRFLGSSPRRQRAQGLSGDPLLEAFRQQVAPFVDANDPASAEAVLIAQGPLMTSEAQAEAGQRVAWIYYVVGRDADALRVANQWRAQATGEWGGQAAWIGGLAAWRMGDCNGALNDFRDATRLTADRELATAGLFWASRSAQACGRAREVQPYLRQAAARGPDSFYGLLARETLGMGTTLDTPRREDTAAIDNLPNIQRARLLARMGERNFADQLIRYQARIGTADEHDDLVRLTRELELPGTQYYLAHNGPPGARVSVSDRFPTFRWKPAAGWRIDPALAMAHSRQESDFRAGVISSAGAVGLMQVRPGTAGDFARARGTALGNLADPSTNLEYGQSFIEMMRGKPATRGQLLKVIAAYNAGPLPVDRWNYINDKGDPLLWLESLPYWETRYYVPSVLRNMFVYQGMDGRDQPALKSLAQHQWPAFPTR